VQTGQDALQRLMHPGISLVILDLGLPDLDGLQVLEGLRERGSTVPVLVLSARGRLDDRVKGLDLGADDYLGKPFAFEELLARVRANLRPRTTISPGVLRAGGICIDPLRREVTVGGRTVSLSAREFYLLKAFADHPGQVLSRQELLSMAWGMNFDPRPTSSTCTSATCAANSASPPSRLSAGQGTASRSTARHRLTVRR
jgi:two-component system copper resistance phosphate regulon response regulator CusR